MPWLSRKAFCGGGGYAHVPHQVGAAFGDVGSGTELIGVDDAVIGIIRRGQAGELVRVSLPVELAAVHDHAAQSGGVTVQVFGGGVHHNVRAELKGLGS